MASYGRGPPRGGAGRPPPGGPPGAGAGGARGAGGAGAGRGGDDSLRRLAILHPRHERRERVKAVGGRAAGAVVHPRHRKKAREVAGLPVVGRLKRLVPRPRVVHGEDRVGHAVVHDHLAAAVAQNRQIRRVRRCHEAHCGLRVQLVGGVNPIPKDVQIGGERECRTVELGRVGGRHLEDHGESAGVERERRHELPERDVRAGDAGIIGEAAVDQPAAGRARPLEDLRERLEVIDADAPTSNEGDSQRLQSRNSDLTRHSSLLHPRVVLTPGASYFWPRISSTTR
jgi:hypothetical protein